MSEIVDVCNETLLDLIKSKDDLEMFLRQLLEREHEQNLKLQQKQFDITKLKRRASYQELHLDELEEQTQLLEESLEGATKVSACICFELMRLITSQELQNERNRRKNLEVEFGVKLQESNVTKPNSRGELETREEKFDANYKETFRLKFRLGSISESNHHLCPLNPKLISPVAGAAAKVAQKRMEALSYLSTGKNEKLVPSKERPPRINSLRDSFKCTACEDYRKLFETERQKREQVEAELAAAIADNCQLRVNNGNDFNADENDSIATDICFDSHGTDFEASDILFDSSGKDIKMNPTKDTIHGIIPEILIEGNSNPFETSIIENIQRDGKAISVFSSLDLDDDLTTYFIQVEHPNRSRIVPLRFKYFQQIHQKLEGFLAAGSFPRPPFTGRTKGPICIKRRRNWLVQIAIQVNLENPSSFDAFLDFVALLNEGESPL